MKPLTKTQADSPNEILYIRSECYDVVRIDGEDGVVKRVRIDRERITLTSVNPYYPPRVFEREAMNTVAVVGKIIQSQRSYK